jgi:alginate O-acetyltransferase complex protein AlgI
LIWIGILIGLFDTLSPWVRLFAATVLLLFSIKLGAYLVLSARSVTYDISILEALLFWTVWPAVRIDRFSASLEERTPRGSDFVQGYVFLMTGLVLALGTVLFTTSLGQTVSSWVFILALLFMGHLGLASIMPFLLRWAGYPVPAMFNDPLESQSIGDFWSNRWNLPFVNMNRLFITRPFADRIGFAWAAFLAFLVSGVLHELAISYAAGGGWGLPILYFLIQSALYETERRYLPNMESASWGVQKLWVWGGILLPLPLLFHGPFRQTFIVPVIDILRTLLLSQPAAFYVDIGLWIGAAGHFLVLAASVQVPEQLEWREDLKDLKSLNRKLLWTYAGFIVLIIVSFGILTAVFHDAFLAGNRVALGLAALIAVFWIARIIVDATYFSHDDWPEGLEFIVGHTMLTSLFILLVVIYVGTILFHVAPL